VATFVTDLSPPAYRAECDRCGWESAPVHRELARAWAAEHRVRCPFEPVSAQAASSTVAREDEAIVLVLDGELDTANAAHVRDELHGLLDDAPARLVIDLREVTFVDSTGIGVLVGAARRARTTETSLSLRGPTRATLRVLELTGLSETFDIC
jgi:anti-sigma B factor antagonist